MHTIDQYHKNTAPDAAVYEALCRNSEIVADGGVDAGVWGLNPLKICRRGQSMF